MILGHLKEKKVLQQKKIKFVRATTDFPLRTILHKKEKIGSLVWSLRHL